MHVQGFAQMSHRVSAYVPKAKYRAGLISNHVWLILTISVVLHVWTKMTLTNLIPILGMAFYIFCVCVCVEMLWRYFTLMHTTSTTLILSCLLFDHAISLSLVLSALDWLKVASTLVFQKKANGIANSRLKKSGAHVSFFYLRLLSNWVTRPPPTAFAQLASWAMCHAWINKGLWLVNIASHDVR